MELIDSKRHFFRFSGNFLKTLAYITMFIDHIARGFIYYLIQYKGSGFEPGTVHSLQKLYSFMRAVGRVSFPLFCFLLVEGCIHTKNKARYVQRLFIFAVISEVPFDFMLHRKPVSFEHQNVLWTLMVGALMIFSIERLRHITGDSASPDARGNGTKTVYLSYRVSFILQYLTCVAAMLITYFGKTDYKTSGIPLIFILYLFHSNENFKLFTGYIVFYTLTKRIWSFPAFIIMKFYDGSLSHKPGTKAARWAYLLYPAHIIIINIAVMVFITGIN